MVLIKKFLIGILFFSFALVLACRRDNSIGSDTLKVSLISDPSFVKYKLLQDSLMIGIWTFKYNLSKTDLATVRKTPITSKNNLQKTYEKAGLTNAKEYVDLQMRISILNARLLKKYPVLKTMSVPERMKIYRECGLKSKPTEVDMDRIEAADKLRVTPKK